MHRSPLALALALPLAAASLHAQPATPRWYRGNTHVHTTASDGNASPEDVARWYRDHGYDFLVVTDHETITDVAPLNALPGGTRPFLAIAGQEITQQVADARAEGPRQAHVNALGATRVVLPLGERNVATGTSVAETYARNLAAVRASGAVATVNHPNFRWSVGVADMARLPDSTLFEVWNGEPRINNLGGDDGAGHVALSTEALWDSLLTRGRLLFGVASDDSHKFRAAQFEDPEATRPGLAWVMVRADTLTAGAILGALRRGDFYATNGVTLAEYRATPREIVLRVGPDGPRDDRRYVTRFIGRGGRVLASVAGLDARYAIRGDEGYVRATVTDSNGRRAWTQPTWVGRR
jgi:hypothetical protein